MQKSLQPPPAARNGWDAPRLVKLGTIADVAGNGPTGSQGVGNAKS